MSIKKKLSLIMSGSLVIILLLNLILSLYTTQVNLRKDSESKMMIAARQVAVSVEQSQHSSDYVEHQIGELLRMASILAAKDLDPDIKNITNEQLKKLSEQVGVNDISLLVRRRDDIVIARSSDPEELGMSAKGWGFWNTAFSQLFNQQKVTVSQGTYYDNFWTGPFEYSTSNPNVIDKWGYYYDAKRNYIIDPFIRRDSVNDYATNIVNPEEIMEKTKQINEQILEITCFNPLTFGSKGMAEQSYDSYNSKLHNQPIRFGTYAYGDLENDKLAVAKTIEMGENVVYETKIKGTKVLKSFIPVNNPNKPVYVIGVVMDYAGITKVLKEQLISYLSISAILLIIFIIGSYVLAGYIIRPIESILIKVKDVAAGRFDTPLVINSKDELGLLSSKINTMTRNLSSYTNQLKQAVEETRSVKDHFESVIEQSADAIHIVDLSCHVIQVNQAFEKLYGWKSHELIGKPLNIIPGFLLEDVREKIDALLQGERQLLSETLRIQKDGTLVEVNISTSPVRSEEGEIISFVSISRDMTERNRMDEMLRRSEKLTTVGQLAAGVAHEIRNPLTTLRGFLQLQQQNNKLNRLHNEIMLSELERINFIVGEFLILSKPQAVLYQTKDVRHILGDVLSLLDSEAHLYGVEFKFDFECDPFEVHCEENQLKQVFINILKNAMEAMPQGGVILLEIFRPNPNHIGISIVDEGVGIPEHIMPKIGEPFFTNKENGTGLGLMVSQRIIEGHKGSIEIKSKLGKGTRIVIILPAAQPGNETEEG